MVYSIYSGSIAGKGKIRITLYRNIRSILHIESQYAVLFDIPVRLFDVKPVRFICVFLEFDASLFLNDFHGTFNDALLTHGYQKNRKMFRILISSKRGSKNNYKTTNNVTNKWQLQK